MEEIVSSLREAWEGGGGVEEENRKKQDALMRIALEQLDRLPLLPAHQTHAALSTPVFSPLMPSWSGEDALPIATTTTTTTTSTALPLRRTPSNSANGLNVQAFLSARAPPPQALVSNTYEDGEEVDPGRKRFQQQQQQQPPAFTTAKNRFQQQQQHAGSFSNHNTFNNEDMGQQQQQPSQAGPRPFKPPLLRSQQPPQQPSSNNNHLRRSSTQPSFNVKNSIQRHNGQEQQQVQADEENVHPRLKGIDPELIERIENDILESGETVTFDDIAGLGFAKQCIEEMVVWPMKNPELYTGLRQMPRGVLLFGPPGNGKTIIGKAIAHECQATFFSISASSLTSKWIGEGEKMVRALFAVAAVRQPSVVFIDEIDSLLTQRSAEENEASRRIKTEFLVQFDGASSKETDLILVIGATNRPQELDEAARRRFVRRLYIPLPDDHTRAALLTHLLKKNEHNLTEEEIAELGALTKGYSGADTTNLAREASMGPLRDVMRSKTGSKELRAITRKDFDVALRSVKASVSNKDLALFERWNEEFGTQQLVLQ